jgi:hypothetical protein
LYQKPKRSRIPKRKDPTLVGPFDFKSRIQDLTAHPFAASAVLAQQLEPPLAHLVEPVESRNCT